MSVDPGFCFLTGGGDLLAGHLGGQAFETSFADFVALGGGNGGPKISFVDVFRDTASSPVVGTEVRLRVDLALIGGTFEPTHRLSFILRDVFAIVIAHSHLPLSVWVSLIGEFAQFRERGRLQAWMRGDRMPGGLGRLNQRALARRRCGEPVFFDERAEKVADDHHDDSDHQPDQSTINQTRSSFGIGFGNGIVRRPNEVFGFLGLDECRKIGHKNLALERIPGFGIWIAES